jgi:hypothetical protein
MVRKLFLPIEHMSIFISKSNNHIKFWDVVAAVQGISGAIFVLYICIINFLNSFFPFSYNLCINMSMS